MRKYYSLRSAFIGLLLCISNFGFGQILVWQFNGSNGQAVSYNSTTTDANLEISTLTRGAGATTAVSVTNAFVSVMTVSADKAAAVANNAYFQFTVKAKATYFASLTDLDVSFRISDATLAAHFYQFQYSLDGTSFVDIGSPVTLTDINVNGVFQPTVDLTTFSNLKNVPSTTTITFRVYAWGGTTGSFGFGKSGSADVPTLFVGGVVTNAVASVSSNPKIIGWDLSTYTTVATTLNATTSDVNLDVPVLSRGAGLTVPAAYNYTFVSTTPTLTGVLSTKALAKTNNEYLQLSIPPKSGYSVSLSTLKYKYRTYGSGPINYRWAYSIDGGSTFIEIGAADGVHATSTGGQEYQIDLSGVNALQNNSSTVLFRMYVWGASISNSFGFGRILASTSTGAPINSIYLRGTTAKVNSAGQLLAWQFNTSNNSKAALLNSTTNNESLEQSVLTRGTGAPASGSSTYSFVGGLVISADKTEAIANNAYYQFQVKPKSGSYVSLTDMDLNIRIQTYSAKTYQFRYSIDGTNFTDIGSPVTLSDENNNGVFQPTIDVASYADLKNVTSAQTITLRLYAWGGTTPIVGSETLVNFGFGKSLTADVPTLSVGGVVSNSPVSVSSNPKIAGWDFSTLSGTTSGTVNTTSSNVNLDTPVLSRGAGLTAANLNFSYASLTTVLSATKTAAKTNNEYFQLSIPYKSGYGITLSTLKYIFRTYSTGATNYRWAYSTDNGSTFTEIGDADGTSVIAPGGNEYQVDLSGVSALQKVSSNVLLRMYVWGATLNTSIFGFGRYLASSSTGAPINSIYLRGEVLPLPVIAATTAATSITPTAAVSGGNITSDGGSTATARGICWSTTTGPTIALSTKTVESGTTGVFSSNLVDLSAATTYYVRAYATNNAGTVYGTEVSFTTSILISAPTAATDLSLTATSDISVASNGVFTIDATKEVNSVTIEPGGTLNVTTGNPLTVSTVTLKAGKDDTSFSAKLDANINATTVRLFKTIDDQKWYFMSFPCDVSIAGITKSDGLSLGTLGVDWFIKYYDGHNRGEHGVGNNWVAITDADMTTTYPNLHANQGYIFGLKTEALPYNLEFSFPLLPAIITTESSTRNIPVAANSGAAVSTNHGWNLIGQPYLSKYVGSNAEGDFNIYISDGSSTYTPFTKGNVPKLNPFSAYFIQANATLAGTGIDFSLGGRQGAPSVVSSELSDQVQLNFASPTGTDYTLLTMNNDLTTAYEIGKDLEKWIGTGTAKPQVYTMLGGINYAFNALPMSSVVNLPINFYTQTAGSNTISVDATKAPSLSKLLLLDNKIGTTTDLLISNYTFATDAGTTTNRFLITAQRIATDNGLINNEFGEIGIAISNGKLMLNNIADNTTVRVFDAIGRMVVKKTANGNSMEIKLNTTGIYTIQILSGTKSVTQKVVL